MKKEKKTIQERFESSYIINEETGCWEYTKSKGQNGYGGFWVAHDADGRSIFTYAHRIAYQLYKGPIPEGLEVAHLCHNRGCCNPDHLEAMTHQENVQMSKDAGRVNRGVKNSSAKLTEADVKMIRDGTILKMIPISVLARMLGVHRSIIDRILRGEGWLHVA